MADLYLIFFVFGVLLFGAVVAYSYFQNSRKSKSVKDLSSQQSSGGELATSSSNADAKSPPTIDLEEDVGDPSSIASVGDGEQDLQPQYLDSQVEDEPTATDAQVIKPSAKAGALSRAKAAISSATISKVKAKKRPQNPEGFSDDLSRDDGPKSKIEPSLNQADDEPASDGDHALITTAGDDPTVIVDLVAKVMNPSPIEQNELLALFREHDFKFHRKVHIYGLNELTDMWRDIEFELPSARFLELGISIQLCDREGPMNEKESHDFQQMVLQFCERYDAPFEFSMKIEDALRQAQTLDQIGRRYDCMAVLNVVPKAKSGFRMADIQSCARDLMMSSDKNGIFMKTEGQKNNITILYRLACTDGEGHFGVQLTGQKVSTPVHDLVVYMNVPATRDPETVFQQMVKDANDLATWLDGKVVDRSGKTMTQRTYTTLMQQISGIAYSMQQDGLAPGDAVAKKLF